ncbi:MAG: hypothetical protein JW940_32805 [Polyangiaceae bacterium]|nr:hypothetical protein [Polyangiaceae bacterium]
MSSPRPYCAADVALALTLLAPAATAATDTPSVPPAEAAPELPAREGYSRFAVYAELAGMAFMCSWNLDYRPVPKVSLRAGVGFSPFNAPGPLSRLVTPIAAAALLGGERHFAELGVGYTHFWVYDDDARFVVPSLGYRYQRPDGGFLFRATLTPFFRANSLEYVLPWGGVSFGSGW